MMSLVTLVMMGRGVIRGRNRGRGWNGTCGRFVAK